MRRILPYAVAILVLAVTAAAQVNDQDLDRLIAIGKANRLQDVSYTCTAKRASLNMMGGGLVPLAIGLAKNQGQSSYTVTFVSNRGRIAVAAHEDRALTRAAVPADWLTEGLYAIVSPQFPDQDDDAPPVLPDPVSQFILRTAERKVVMLKLTTSSDTKHTWKGAGGATVDYADLTFTIDTKALDQAETARQASQTYQSSDQGTDVILVTPNGERSCMGVPLKKIRGLVTAKIK